MPDHTIAPDPTVATAGSAPLLPDLAHALTGTPRLFYKDSCPPCRWMSKLAVVLSCGTIRRIAISSIEARALYAIYPQHAGQLLLIEGSRLTAGRLVFAAVPATIVRAVFRLPFRFLGGLLGRLLDRPLGHH